MPTVDVVDVELFHFVVVAKSDGGVNQLALQCRRETAVQRLDTLLGADDVHSSQQSAVLEVRFQQKMFRRDDRALLALNLVCIHVVTTGESKRRGSVVRASVSNWRTFPDIRLIYC